MSKLRLNITMSVDGFVAGPNQSERDPLGIGGMQLHRWLLPLKAFRETHGEEGGEVNASTPIAEEILGNVGATIMGRNMFGGGPGPWGDDPWKGYWGDNPPYHNPVFVLTHHAREPPGDAGGHDVSFRHRWDRVSARAGRGCSRRKGRLARRWRERRTAISRGRPARRDAD